MKPHRKRQSIQTVDATERVPPSEKYLGFGGPRFIVAGISYMFQRHFKVLSLMTAAVLLQACASTAPATTNEAVAVQSDATNVHGSVIEEYLHPGTPIRAAAGQKFSIRIKANPTTGYGWQLSKPLDEHVLSLVANVYIRQPDERQRVGVGGHEIWTFKAVGQGQAEIALKYVRPWEKDKPPVDTNVFTVIVK